MASFEGPASSGGELYGAASSPMTAPSVPEAPKLTPERAQQELARLTAIIKDNPNLHFLEPRVVKCVEVGTQDSATFLSFYRLISQSLSEELMQQKEKIKDLESNASEQKKVSAQSEMEAALAEASDAVNRAQGQPAPAAAEGAPAAAEGSGGENSAQVDELIKKLEQAEVQRERLLQDMQNMRNRSKTDIDVKVFKAVEKFTQSLLPALDAFHSAMPSLKTTTDTASIVTGIEMIHEQLENALKQAGLQKLDVVGQPFDPHLHEAIGEVQTGDVPDDHIYDQLQPGYLFGERLVRAAIVRIARNDGSMAPTAAAPAQPAAEAPAPAAPSAQPAAEAPAPAAPVQPAAEAPAPPPQPAAEAPAPAAPPAQPAAEAPAPAAPVQPAAEAPAPAAPPQPAAEAPAPAAPPAQPAAEAPAPAAPPAQPAAEAPAPAAPPAQPAAEAPAPPAPVQPAAEATAPGAPPQPAAEAPAPAAPPAQPAAEAPAPAAPPAQPAAEVPAPAAPPAQPAAEAPAPADPPQPAALPQPAAEAPAPVAAAQPEASQEAAPPPAQAQAPSDSEVAEKPPQAPDSSPQPPSS